MVTIKKLHRSKKQRMIAGVCGGIAENFEADVSLVRIAFIILGLSTGFGIALYIIMAIIVPEE